ncbi:MAG: hypothetical protein ABIH99_02095 [Candidatus Micrarchaeota archaeon]
MKVDEQFKATCRVLFGEELGKLNDFKPYLLDMVDPPLCIKSIISKKNVYLSRPYYCKGAKFRGLGETDEKHESLTINEVKDIDSVLSALAEKFHYCGNKNLGTSVDVLESDMCNDSMSVLASQNIMSSKYVAYSNGIRESECIFGCMLGGEVKFSMHSHVFFYSTRCFDSYICVRSSDMYGCFNCQSCSDNMFTLNQKSKRNCIGNLELSKEKYLEIKKKIVAEIADELKRKKRFPSIFEIAGGDVDD